MRNFLRQRNADDLPLLNAVIRMEPEIVVLDALGFSLQSHLFRQEDIFPLVGDALRKIEPQIAEAYTELRIAAEERVMVEAAETNTCATIADVATVLSDLFALHGLDPDLADTAISAELEFVQMMWRSNPEALSLVEGLHRARVPVAHIADSHLPRDLIAKMLHGESLPSRSLFVSSHEGVSSRDAQLIARIVQRTGVAPEEILYLAPDLPGQEIAITAGCMFVAAPEPSRDPVATLQPSASPRTGLESLALGLAARRLAHTAEHEPDANATAYTSLGPLLSGFGCWLGEMIDVQMFDHVVFCGPGSGLLREVLLEVKPQLLLQRVTVVSADDPEADNPTLEQLAASDNARVLVAGLCTGPNADQIRLAGRLRKGGSHVESAAAYSTGRLPTPLTHNHYWVDPASAETHVRFRARHHASLVQLLGNGTKPGELQHSIEAGVLGFAADLARVTGLVGVRTSSNLAEPAYRLLNDPSSAECTAFAEVAPVDASRTLLIPRAARIPSPRSIQKRDEGARSDPRTSV